MTLLARDMSSKARGVRRSELGHDTEKTLSGACGGPPSTSHRPSRTVVLGYSVGSWRLEVVGGSETANHQRPGQWPLLHQPHPLQLRLRLPVP